METPNVYEVPKAELVDAPASASRFNRLERVLFWLLIVNSAIGFLFLGVAVYLNLSAFPSLYFVISVLFLGSGVASALIMIRRPTLGLGVGAFFYALQVISYIDRDWAWSLRAGFNFDLTISQGGGTLVINVLAVAFALVHISAAINHHERSRKVPDNVSA